VNLIELYLQLGLDLKIKLKLKTLYTSIICYAPALGTEMY